MAADIRQSRIANVKAGEQVVIMAPCNIYGCTLGNRTFVGPFTEIQKGVVIGDRCKIQSHSFICEKVTIGNDCFIGHGVMFINDAFASGAPAGGDTSKWRPTRLGNHVSVGSNATILPVSICDHVVIGAGSVVTHDIVEPGIYAGNPARFLRAL